MGNTWSLTIYLNSQMNKEEIAHSILKILHKNGYNAQNPYSNEYCLDEYLVDKDINYKYENDFELVTNLLCIGGITTVWKKYKQEYLDLHISRELIKNKLCISTLCNLDAQRDEDKVLSNDLKSIFIDLCNVNSVEYGIGTSEWTLEALFIHDFCAQYNQFEYDALHGKRIDYLFWLNYINNERYEKNIFKLKDFKDITLKTDVGVIIDLGRYCWNEESKILAD